METSSGRLRLCWRGARAGIGTVGRRSAAPGPLSSPLMGMLEKRRAAKFFGWAQEYEPKDPKTWGKLRPQEQTMKEA
eukprot:gene11580-biopygen2979